MDGQTDRQNYDSQDCASIAVSRGENKRAFADFPTGVELADAIPPRTAPASRRQRVLPSPRHPGFDAMVSSAAACSVRSSGARLAM